MRYGGLGFGVGGCHFAADGIEEAVHDLDARPHSRGPHRRHAPFQGSGCRIQDSGFRVRVQGSGFRVQGSGFRIQGSGFLPSRTSTPAPTRAVRIGATHLRG